MAFWRPSRRPRSASGSSSVPRRGRLLEKLVGEDRPQPRLVALTAPAPVGDEQGVRLGRRKGVDDVGGVALAEPRPQGVRTSQRAGDALLALVGLPGALG